MCVCERGRAWKHRPVVRVISPQELQAEQRRAVSTGTSTQLGWAARV